jgi:hypothetical protein
MTGLHTARYVLLVLLILFAACAVWIARRNSKV